MFFSASSINARDSLGYSWHSEGAHKHHWPVMPASPVIHPIPLMPNSVVPPAPVMVNLDTVPFLCV
ncbi:hypothetical protein SLEP1_g59730 [Rubroshorea leprosula]|uniref:Uncharacterized protein n=1 Tax=Rubroshorea leprosula TaxID=152421 RepID=A0AAV5MUR0_9ROSI|nr:hypothetical protein SLEP1_g59730 [Rubroshorea leprosula]